MMSMPLSEVARVLKGVLHGENVTFTGLSTDTRTICEGNLFVALQGPNFDGHDYLQQAQHEGAVAAAVSHVVQMPLPQVEVEDTRHALGQLAAYWRSRFELPVVAVTGSNGKTSVREMIAAILRSCGETLVTRGNLNNDIGVPLTLSGLSEVHRYAVIELGANHPGEIAYLADIVKPTVAVVNNAAEAHLEGFGDLDGVARGKGELFERLPDSAVCIINADDAYAGLWLSLAGSRKVITFGLEADADVRASWQGDLDGSDIRLQTLSGDVAFRLPLPGRHNVMNALAASAAAIALELSPETIARGLSSMQAVGGRWQPRKGLQGARLIDDTYNANPGSLAVALELLADSNDECWLVLGDMGELGDAGEALHRQMGEYARNAGLHYLFALGSLAAVAAETFGAGGEAFESQDTLVSRLREQLHPGVTILVKGSRAMHMERVVDALCEHSGEAA
ncbi:UDP-N-acetylmuramoyl-tripeptide--D-alanyl-D-alanine ligase [Thiogranum longum]|uniref:UDP-N-acetylmuramoyl-tripeptide--D-alanyl-D-alanine ligase n=1 Tax=Thiogranum longum TaxID=1537524 RepID=A0A4R1H9V4_9GAMM|nr:UDP-N-acetylmuramoyl-tripeptide--D-alanyl-D-alanine ligase [Thiogranum longum]TCK17311.1 UDP-N-acetylmuramoyl-tripeptide--D-alanyl-D-alanine ligase [Thiogranum longum]